MSVIDPDALAAAAAAPDVTPSAANAQQLAVLGDELESLRVRLDEIAAEKKLVQERFDDLRTRQLPELMRALGLATEDGRGSFTLASGARISLRTDMYASVVKAKEPELFAWLRSNQLADMIRETVNPQTLRAFCRERAEEGTPLPPGVTTYTETSATLTRSRA